MRGDRRGRTRGEEALDTAAAGLGGHISVRGDQRKDVDMGRLARVLIAQGRALEDEQQFLEGLQRHDERVGIATFLPLRTHVGILAERVFVLFNDGRLIYRLPENVVDELVTQPG